MSNNRPLLIASMLAQALSAAIIPLPAFSAATGLDTPTGVTDLPFSIQGTQMMDLTGTGLGVNLIGPTQALDVNGYVRIRSINGEGATIQMDGANSVTMYAENLNGTFRLVNSPWNAQLFSVDQSGNLIAQGSGNFAGSSLTVGNGGPGVLHLYGSTVYDTGSYLHLGSGYIYADGNVIVAGTTTSNNEFIGTMQGGYGQVRMIGGSYGAFFRNDGGNTYLLLTAAGDQYGAWNGLRPLYVNDVSGVVNFGQGIDVTSGGITFPDGTVQTTAASAHQFGGMYVIDQLNRCWNGGNPFTGACNCPSGTSPHAVGNSNGAGGLAYQNVYAGAFYMFTYFCSS